MPSSDADGLLTVLRTHADCVLREARGPGLRPDLFPDALDVDSRLPPVWLHPEDGRPMILSNFANQQDWLRLLTGLSRVTGDPRYVQAAEATVGAAFAQGRDASGLLHWGGHRAVDLNTGAAFGMDDFHELKTHFPYYDLLWRVNPEATRVLITAFWQRHVLDWNRFDLNRHGHYGPHPSPGDWPELRELAPVFFVGEGLSFINTGSDLVYSAALLSEYSGTERPGQWAARLARRYAEETRHPVTGLGGYQFSRIENDRAEEQLGPEFGERAREYSVLDRTRASRKFGVVGLSQLELAERLQSGGQSFLHWAVADLTAFARHAYDPDSHLFHALLRDGTRLSPSDVRRPGYYRPETFQPYPVSPLLFWAYARAFRLSGDPFLAETTRALAGDLGLGAPLAGQPKVSNKANDAWTLLALIELHRAQPARSLLPAALAVAKNILRDRFTGGLFVETIQQRYARIGRPEPLALLHLVAALRGDPPDLVPAQLPGEKYFTAHWHGKGRTSDYLEWFPQRRTVDHP